MQFRIDGFQVSSLWKRHEVVTSCIANQIFDASFLPPGMHIGKERFEAIDTVEVQKHFVLSSAMPFQHLEYGGFEVIVDDYARHSAPELKGMALTEQKRFLPLGGETFDKHRPGKAEASGQEKNFHQLAFDLDCRFAKVKLCPLTRRKVERNICGFRSACAAPAQTGARSILQWACPACAVPPTCDALSSAVSAPSARATHSL